MFKLKKIKQKTQLIILFSILIMSLNISTTVFAYNSEKKDLEIKLEQQENNIKEDMGDITPRDDTFINDSVDSVMKAEYKGFNVREKIDSISNFIKNFIVKSRSTVIIFYGLVVTILTIYIATIGSRNLNKRRHGLFLLIGNTLLFLVFINIPLVIIYFSVAKENIAEISIYRRILDMMDFLKSNSLIISALLAYLGMSKLIVSRKDLPNKQQGEYFLKSAVIVLLVLNLVPIAIKFII